MRLVPVGDLAVSSYAIEALSRRGELERAPSYVPVGRAVANSVGRFFSEGRYPFVYTREMWLGDKAARERREKS